MRFRRGDIVVRSGEEDLVAVVVAGPIGGNLIVDQKRPEGILRQIVPIDDLQSYESHLAAKSAARRAKWESRENTR